MSTKYGKFILSTNIKTWVNDLRAVSGAIRAADMSVATIGAVDYTRALDGLSLKQAQLMLTTQGVVGEEQRALLVKQGLIATSDRMSASLVSEALANGGLNKEKADEILIDAGLMSQNTKELISENAVTEAKLRAILAEKGIKGAKADTLIASILQTGQNTKEALSWKVLGTAAKEAMVAMLHNPLTWIVVAIASIGLLVKGYDALIGKQEKLSRQKIEGLDEDITRLDEEIKSLEELQSKLENAKGSRYELSQIQSELNDAIGETPGLLNGESKAWDVANAKLKANLELKKQQREQSQRDRVDASKDLYDSNSMEIDWRADLSGDKAREYAEALSWMNGKSFDEFYGSEEYNKLSNLQQSLLWEAVGFKNSYTEEWSNYWKEQIDTAYDVFEDTIANYDGAGGQDFIKGLISDMIQDGATLSEISEVVMEVINNQDMQDAINKYWESFVNPDINSEQALQAVKKIFDDIVTKNPALKDFFDNFYNGIIAGGKAATDTSSDVDGVTASLSELEKVSDNIKPLGTAFKELSDDGYITIKTLKEMKEAADLSSEEWAEYETKLLKAKVGSSEFNQIMSDLTYKILDNTFAGKDLNTMTEQQITAVLRENGVVNASAVAHDWLTIAKAKNKLATFDFNNATQDELDTLYKELKVLGLTETAVGNLSKAYAEAQAAMLQAATTGALNRLKISQDELKGVKSVADAYKLMAGKSYDVDGDGTGDYYGSEKNRSSFDPYREQYNEDVEKVVALAKAQEEIDKIINSINTNATIPNYSGAAKDKSDKNEALDNYLKDAENRYKIHQDETKYIQELQYAYAKLTKNEKERLDITGKINEAYRDLADNRIKDIEHQIDLVKELHGDDADVTNYYREIQRISHEEANRLRSMGYDDNSNEIQDLQKTWWDAQKSIVDWDWDSSNDWIDKRNEKGDWALYGDSEYEAWQRVVRWLREKYPNEVEKIHEATQNAIDARWNNSNSWIDERNTYNDWRLFGDSEIDAWERVIKWLKEEYPDELEKIKEAEQNLFEARKKELNKANDFGNTYLESKKTLLQSYYDVANSVAEAQHEINKELEVSKTMYEYLDDDTRKLLFNQEDYNKLNAELIRIQGEATRLQSEYEDKLRGSTLETIESITSEYQMQYETLMKSYEIAKADLEIAKKKQKLNNVLNERNVRMFINGSWQWVANTEDVANAKSELADAEYAKRVAESGLTQQNSINELTKKQDELGVVIKKFEGGVIDLDEAVRLAKDAIGSMPDALYSMFSDAATPSSGSGYSGRGYSFSGGGSGVSSEYVSWAKAQMAANSNAWLTADAQTQKNLHAANQLLGQAIGSTYDKASGVWTHKYASGSKYTKEGLSLMGEEGSEVFITASGRLIPINQPTIGNISSGGVVFNAEQMKNLRTMWDMSNLNLNTDKGYINMAQPQQIDQSQNNSITINGMTVDSGSSDGQALISALRRYVGNH